jgi:hypothetical protein
LNGESRIFEDIRGPVAKTQHIHLKRLTMTLSVTHVSGRHSSRLADLVTRIKKESYLSVGFITRKCTSQRRVASHKHDEDRPRPRQGV